MQLTNIMGISTSVLLLIFAADVHKGRQPNSDDESDLFKSPPKGNQTPGRHHGDIRTQSRLHGDTRTPSRLHGDTRN